MNILIICKTGYMGTGNKMTRDWLSTALSNQYAITTYTIGDTTQLDTLELSPSHWDIVISWNNSIFDAEAPILPLKRHPNLQFLFFDCPLIAHLTYIKDKPENRMIWESSTLWCYDAYFVEYFKENGFPNFRHFPHATYRQFPENTAIMPTVKRPIDIAFVGSLNNPLALHIEKQMNAEAKELLSKLKEACFEEHLPKLNTPFFTTYMRVLDEPGGIEFIATDIQAYYFYFAALVHCTYALRRHYVYEVAKHHSVHVFNNDTLAPPKYSTIIQGSCTNLDQLFNIYATSKICLNGPHLQQIDGLNQRYFNVTAMGAYLISPTPGHITSLWNAISTPEQHFRTTTELVNLVSNALQNQPLSDTLNVQRRTLLLKHSPVQRATQITSLSYNKTS